MPETQLPYTFMTPYFCVADMNYDPIDGTFYESPEQALRAAAEITKTPWPELRDDGYKLMQTKVTIVSEVTMNVDFYWARVRSDLFKGNR